MLAWEISSLAGLADDDAAFEEDDELEGDGSESESEDEDWEEEYEEYVEESERRTFHPRREDQD